MNILKMEDRVRLDRAAELERANEDSDADAGERAGADRLPRRDGRRAEGPHGGGPRGGGRRGLRIGLLALLAVAGLVAFGNFLVARWTHVYVNDSRIAANVVALGSEVAGRVTAVNVVAGDRVAKGDLLVRLDSRQAQLRLQELDAEVSRIAAEQAQLRAEQAMIEARIRSRLDAGRAQVRASEAEHRATRAELDATRSDYERQSSLRRSGAVSMQQFEEVRARHLTAQQKELRAAAEIESARAALAVIESEGAQVQVLDRQIAVLEAQRTSLEAKRAQQRVDLEDREVRAAFDGVVDATFVDVGEHVSPGSRLLMYHDPTRVWVDANVKETEFRRLRLGAAATVRVDAYPDRVFKAEVVRLGNAATSEFALLPSPNPSGNFTKVTQRLPVRMSIEQDASMLRPGMMVELAIDAAD
jgi:membrane fusion protein (multidrug efflux system)